jgi:hypothetical protein
MPQRTFWAARHEVAVAYGFALDPLAPGSPPTMTAAVYDQAKEQVAYRNLHLPPMVAEDAFLDVLATHYRTWMLADASCAQKALLRQQHVWWDVADSGLATR